MKIIVAILERLGIRRQIWVSTITNVVMVTAILTGIAFFVMQAALEREFDDRLKVAANSMLEAREVVKQKVLGYSNLLMKRYGLGYLVSIGDSASLEGMMTDDFQTIHGWDPMLNLMEAIDAQGIVVMRGQEPARRGDDLSAMPLIAGAIQGQVTGGAVRDPVTGELGFESVSPLWREGQVLGAIRVGSYFKDETAEYIKRVANVEVVFFSGERVYASTLPEAANLTLGRDFIDSLVPMEARHQLMEIGGQQYAAFFVPTINPQGTVGVMAGLLSRRPIEEAKKNLLLYLLAAAGACLLIFIGMGFVTVHFLTSSMTRIVRGMDEGATQVTASAAQVAAGGQELAEGATEQAASLEETSASLEEIAAMTNQNAENSRIADNLMREANEIVKRAAGSMAELTASMHSIQQASEETSKIIRTIDEIAFQTNLLALNAAVEAARAGEAGAGFAVVADEVRNLAMRAAEAAKNTAALIDGTAKKVGDGNILVDRTNSAFAEVAESAGKAAALIGEIAVASGEQAQGIGQLNKAVSEMDQVVQRTAANAEESAASAQELNAMAAQMEDFVRQLNSLVVGAGAGAATDGGRSAGQRAGASHLRQLTGPDEG